MNYNYNPFRSFRTYPMQTLLDSYLMPPPPKRRPVEKIEKIDKRKKIILESNRKHNNGQLKCQFCKQNIYFTGKQRKPYSVSFNYVCPKEYFQTEDEYYSYYNCVACCQHCNLTKKDKSYDFLVKEIYNISRIKIPKYYETPMILD